MKKTTRPVDDCPVTIQLRVAEEIAARNLTIASVARMSKVHENTVSRLCNNRRPRQIDCQVIAAIAHALELKDPGVLFEFAVKEIS